MDTFLGRYKNLIVLAAILFAQIIALAVQVRRPSQDGGTLLIRVWAISAVTPIEKAVVHSQEWVQNLWTSYAYLRGVRRENRDLHAEIERMKINDARLQEDATMARRVQALLGFKEQYVDSTIAAQVIGTSGSDQSRVLYIDKGAGDGIKPDMAVITPTGIVGKIVQVFPDSSQVLPINDQFSGVGAALKDSRLQGILKGASNGATTLQYIMSDEKVTPGEDVITSGGDRIFPKGLPVGKVATVEPGKDLFLNIRVIPAAHLDQLEEVLVVTKITEKMPDSKDLGPLRASDILAERLPGVPSKPADASGNPQAPGANGSAVGTAPNGPHPIAGSTTGKPATTAAPGTQNRPTGAATPRTNTSGTAPGAVNATKLKPATVKPQTPASSGNATGSSRSTSPATDGNGNPLPRKAQPATAPGTNTEQPTAPPAGAPPQL